MKLGSLPCIHDAISSLALALRKVTSLPNNISMRDLVRKLDVVVISRPLILIGKDTGILLSRILQVTISTYPGYK